MMNQAEAENLFRRIIANPGDEDAKNQLVDAFDQDPKPVLKGVGVIANEIDVEKHLPEAIPITRFGSKKWSNCIGEQVCIPAEWRKPQHLKDLVDSVREARSKKVPVRAVGSGHAFSDITRTDGAILIDPHEKMAEVLDLDAGALKSEVDSAALFRVQCGITIANLNTALEEKGLALINMGAYDGQTVAGALSTGTHGSGAAYGPMASFLRSIVLVTETGTVYQIEPGSGITDPAKFSGKLSESDVPVVLKQDDNWFRAAQIAMGCLGIIYSYTLQVTLTFSISENRTMTTWETVKPLLLPTAWAPLPQPLKEVDHYELMVNPYANLDGTHTCVKVERMRIPRTEPHGSRHGLWGKILEWVGVKSSGPLVLLLNLIPSLSPRLINTALDFLRSGDPPYVDISHAVFNLGIVNTPKALALELHFDAVDCVATIDKILETFRDLANLHGWYLAGPIGIRFIAASDAFLAPQAGRLTCTAELCMLFGINSGQKLLQEMKKALCDLGNPGGNKSVRIHWGLDLDFTRANDVRNWYPDFDKWQAVYRELNTTGMFDNKFTRRIRLKSEARPYRASI